MTSEPMASPRVGGGLPGPTTRLARNLFVRGQVSPESAVFIRHRPVPAGCASILNPILLNRRLVPGGGPVHLIDLFPQQSSLFALSKGANYEIRGFLRNIPPLPVVSKSHLLIKIKTPSLLFQFARDDPFEQKYGHLQSIQ